MSFNYISNGSLRNSVTGFHKRKQLSSLILLISVVIFVNLCPFQQQSPEISLNESKPAIKTQKQLVPSLAKLAAPIESCIKFIKLIFTNPMRFERHTSRYIVAEAKVLGKMAKVWYIKKKIKKLGKKLKKHTIAVPVFTTFPVYDQAYYPHHPNMVGHLDQSGHVDQGAMHHAAAASAYLPAIVPQATQAPNLALSSSTTTSAGSHSSLNEASSNIQHQMAPFRLPVNKVIRYPTQQPQISPMYHNPMTIPSANQIINSYRPAPPTYVDDSEGLYGNYGNAYGRYDGGYQFW